MRFVNRRAVLAYQRRQRSDLGGQCRSPGPGDADPGAWPTAGVTLFYLDEPCLFQHPQVPGQVARGESECLPQVAELGALGFRRDGQDAQPVPLVDGLIDAVGRVLRQWLRVLRRWRGLGHVAGFPDHGLLPSMRVATPGASRISAGSRMFGRAWSLTDGVQPIRWVRLLTSYRLDSNAA